MLPVKWFVTILAGLSVQCYRDGTSSSCVSPSVWDGGARASGLSSFSRPTGLASGWHDSPRSNRAG
eukprot:8680152-Pyramimonas_sp.AAC.1